METPGLKAGVIHLQDLPLRSLVEGAVSRLLCGEKIMLSFIEIAPHTHFPRHRHPEEQFMIVLEGQVDEIVGDEIVPLRPGDVCYLPSNLEHGGYTHEEGCRAIDIFSPPRKDYRDLQESAGQTGKKGGSP
jgi:quercetin dioxygenase-like cupin family protein